MKNFVLSLLLVILIGEAVTLLLMHKPKSETKVLAEATVVPSITPIPMETATPTATATPVPTPKPTKKPTPVPTPTPISPAEVSAFVDRFATQYSVDVNVMRHIALCESGFNPNVINGPYVGLFQFDPTTWKDLRLEMGEDSNINLRLSAEESAQTASFAVSIGERNIWPHCNP